MAASMSPRLKIIRRLLSAILAGIIISGSMYFWIDDHGIRHFSNISPPENGRAQQLSEEKLILPRGHQFSIVKIFDGDTLQVKGYGLIFVIRLVGIDTPELGRKGRKNQPYSLQAKQKLTRLLHKKTISIKQYGTGGYNRILAEIFVNGTNVNLEMVRSGLAEVYQGKRPDEFDAALYFQAEKLAQKLRKGMWRQGTAYESPWQWRKKFPPR
jgi:endonuclease YncB( thermonuclease family)